VAFSAIGSKCYLESTKINTFYRKNNDDVYPDGQTERKSQQHKTQKRKKLP
jgi:hypothetical protein